MKNMRQFKNIMLKKQQFEKTIRRLRYHIEEEKKCFEILMTHVDADTKLMMKQLLLGKAYELFCLDQLLSHETECPTP